MSPYSVWMRENADQINSEYAHFLRSVKEWVARICKNANIIKAK